MMLSPPCRSFLIGTLLVAATLSPSLTFSNSSTRGNERAARSAHGLVARCPFRDVHPLGALRAAGPPRMGSQSRTDHQRGLSEVLRALQSRPLQSSRLGQDGETGRHEVRRTHRQASRRLLPVRLEIHRLQSHQHALQERPVQGVCRSVSRRGVEGRVLLLADRLAPPRLHHRPHPPAYVPWTRRISPRRTLPS